MRRCANHAECHLDGSRLVGIVVYGIGYDNIDVEAATVKGIVVCNIPDFMTSEVADHSVALILTLARKLHRIGRRRARANGIGGSTSR